MRKAFLRQLSGLRRITKSNRFFEYKGQLNKLEFNAMEGPIKRCGYELEGVNLPCYTVLVKLGDAVRI